MEKTNDVKIMCSQRGKTLVLYSGYKFYKAYEAIEGNTWRCIQKKCPAKLCLDDTNSTILKENGAHNHEKSANLEREMFSNSLKRKATEDLLQKPQKLILKEIEDDSTGVSENFTTQDLKCLKVNLYRAKRKSIPRLPKSQQEVHETLNQISVISHKGENMIKINDIQNNIIAFSTNTNLEYLSTKSKFFGDGTFTYCVNYFHQLFTIHTLENGNYIPLLFFLLPNKKMPTYEIMFQHLKDLCSNKNPNFHPEEIVADFESAIHDAAKRIWPSINIVGCRFHLTQAWYRNIQSKGLSTEYKDPNSEIGKWLHMLFGLPFLDSSEVMDSFVNDFMSAEPNDERVAKFSDYLDKTYMSDEAQFPPTLWSCPSTASERTTNACESFHSRYNSQFTSPHPSIFIFINVLKNIQTEVYIRLNSIHLKNNTKNLYFKKRREALDKALELYNTRKISRVQFLKIASHHYKKKA